MTTGRYTALQVVESALDGVLRLEPVVHRDTRGSFRELFNQTEFEAATGIHRNWIQDNHSRSENGVLRGIHYQLGSPQGKLVSCVVGEIFDVAVDLRRSSPSFGEWTGSRLSEENGHQLWIPEGFGHAFLVMSDVADVLYKVTASYDRDEDRSLAWDDPDLAIEWPLTAEPQLTDKDRDAPRLREAEVYP
jgi:dTDP-4-dehydrorhamnose 3,5-epimerase